MRKHLATLGLPPDAGPEDIRMAYRRLSKMYHPDLHGDSPEYEERFKAINEAYQALKKPGRKKKKSTLFQQGRRAYDRWVAPDFAREQERKEEARQRTAPGPRPLFGRRGFLTFLLFGLVLLLPFWAARPGPEADRLATVDRGTFPPQPVTTQAALEATPDRDRFQRDLERYRSIRQIDPQLHGLDLETGYYQGRGETFKFSWGFIQYLKRSGG